MRRRLLLTALLCAASALPAGRVLIASAGVVVTASVPSTRMALGDQLVLTVTISGSATAAPKVGPIPDVEIYESGRSSSMMISNGTMTSTVVYAFVLNPHKAGKFKIPPVEVPGAAPAEAIEIEVGAAAAPPPAAAAPGAPPAAVSRPPGEQTPDAFVTAALAKNRAFVNEQVTLVVRFFTAVPLLGRPQYDSPKLSGLLAEEIGGEAQGSTQINGRVYNYSEIRSALFPVQPGRATIGPAVVTVQVPRRGQPGAGDDFFDRFFGMQNPEVKRLTTDPLALQVDALPGDKPDDFSGVVGKLTLDASVDRTTVKAGEAVNLTVKVSGTGNIKTVAEPKRPDLPAARFFDSESSVVPAPPGATIGGTKTFRTVLVPRVSGPLEIPSLSLSYFDPSTRSYKRASSKPLKLTVLAGDPNAAQPIVGPGPGPAPGVTAVSEDIRYLKAPGGESAIGGALGAFGGAGPLHALPAAFLLGALALDWRRRLRASNPAALRSREARENAERRLREAGAATEPAKAVGLLSDALTVYLADKLGLPAAGLTYKAAAARLPQAHAARVKALWDELDLLRYAPAAAGQAEVERLTAELRALHAALDKELP